MQRLIFEYSPLFILLCLAAGVGYAWLLYTSKHTWSKGTNNILFFVRALCVSVMAFMLVGPIIKLTQNLFEKPAIVFLVDNSLSVRESLDSAQREKILAQVRTRAEELGKEDYEVSVRGLGGDGVDFNMKSSDLHGAMRDITNVFE
jgi:hypothetical protein